LDTSGGLPPEELAWQNEQVAEMTAQFEAGDIPSTAELLGVELAMPPITWEGMPAEPTEADPYDDPSPNGRGRLDGAGGVPGRADRREGEDGHGEDTEDPIEPSRRVDLGPWLDGSYEPPKPEVGEYRDDGVRMLYASRWHTVIGPTGCGKSWLGLWHAAQELKAGNLVVYLHFEESTPGGTVGRLLLLGCTPEQTRQRFVWLDCDRRWKAGEFAAELAALPTPPVLVVLDGINACATKHGWHPNDAEAVGSYRYTFVTQATRLGAAVLSLGHPPKAKDRQDERHGYGATGWLDEVDGVGFRLLASKTRPIGKGRSGSSSLYVVKDRYAEVEQHAVPASDKEGWSCFGQFVVDASDPQWLTVRLAVPEAGSDGQAKDPADRLGDEIVHWLAQEEQQRVGSWTALNTLLRARKVAFANEDLKPALLRLVQQGRVLWPDARPGQARPVSLTAPEAEAGDENAPNTGGDSVVTPPRAGNPSDAPPLWDGGARSVPEGELPNAPRSGSERSGAFGAFREGEDTWYRVDEHGEPHCRACGKPLSPAEYQASPDAHDCQPTLLAEGDQQ
jgi:hypothetical protein